MGVWIISSKKRVLISFLAFIILLFSNSLVYSQWTSVTPPSVSTSWWLEGFILPHRVRDGLWEEMIQITLAYCFITLGVCGPLWLPPL